MKLTIGIRNRFGDLLSITLATVFFSLIWVTQNTVADTVVKTNIDAVSTLAAAVNNNPITHPQKLTAADSKKISSSSQLGSLLGGLVLILGLIYGLSWFVKRFSQGGFMQNSTIKMLSSLPLGTRERITLIDVGGKQILLGITATQINALHVFDEAIVASAEKNSPPASDFSQKLVALLQKNMMQQTDIGNNSASDYKNTKK